MVSLAHKTQNDNRFADLMSDVRELGRETATGRDAKAKLALRIIKAAADNVIDLTPDPDTKLDAAYDIYDAYLKADSKKAVFDHTKGGIKKGASEVRTLINMGLMTTVDAVDVMNRTVTIHGNLDPKDRQSAFPAFMAVARAQLNSSDTDLSDDELQSLCLKQSADPKGQAAYIKAAAKALEKALAAEDADPKLADNVQALLDGADAIIGFLAKREERQKLLASLAALDAAS